MANNIPVDTVKCPLCSGNIEIPKEHDEKVRLLTLNEAITKLTEVLRCPYPDRSLPWVIAPLSQSICLLESLRNDETKYPTIPNINDLPKGNILYMSSDGWAVYRLENSISPTACATFHNKRFVAITENESMAFRIICALSGDLLI
jgi:hypothetical protein